MAIKTTALKRVFKHDGTEFPDPSPSSKPERCLEILALTYPKMNNAALDGPFFEAGKEIWQIKVNAGTKG